MRRGHIVDRDFASILPDIEPLSEKVPQWHELTYFIGNVAEGAGNRIKALTYYRRVRTAGQTEEGRARLGAIPADVDRRLLGLGVPTETPLGDAEQRFVAAASKFADLMDLPGDDPAIVFKKSDIGGLQAIWNAEARRYEVNPVFSNLAGLPQYVALMGRFFERNFDKCFGNGRQLVEVNVWNNFRYAVVDYLIQSVPEFSDVALSGSSFPLFQVLKRLDGQPTDAVQRLVLELLWRFDCDWNASNIEEKMLAINKERGLLPEKVIQQAFAPQRSRAAKR